MSVIQPSSERKTFVLPHLHDTFSVFTEIGENPHYDTVRAGARAWIKQFEVEVCGPKMLAFLDNCNFELMNSYTYPYAQPLDLRASMDLTNILFLYDEYTDEATGITAHDASTTVRRSLQEPGFNDGSWICRMMQDFRRMHLERAGRNVAHRFIDNFCAYADEVTREAMLRETNEILDIPGYVPFRREAGAVRTVLDLVELALGLDLPQYVHDDPVFARGHEAAMDLICWSNDVCSYNMEQAKGHHGANLLTVIMNHNQVDLQAASDMSGEYCKALVTQLEESRLSLSTRSDPAFSRDAVRTLENYGTWIRGHNEWLFVTERYFGKQNEEVKKSRVVVIREPFAETVGLKE